MKEHQKRRRRTRGLRMLRGLVLAVLALLLCLPLPVRAAAAPWTGCLHAELLIPALKALFLRAEGDYGSVNPNDNGALSLGLMQWHGARARALLRAIAEAGPQTAAMYLPQELLSRLELSDAEWEKMTVSPTQSACLSALLSSRLGRRVQDETAAQDIRRYLDEAWSAGMRSDETAFYYAAIVNQFGPTGAREYLRRIEQAAQEDDGAIYTDAAALHRAVLRTSYGLPWRSLREKSWDCLCAARWARTDGSEGPGFFDGLSGSRTRGALLALCGGPL